MNTGRRRIPHAPVRRHLRIPGRPQISQGQVENPVRMRANGDGDGERGWTSGGQQDEEDGGGDSRTHS